VATSLAPASAARTGRNLAPLALAQDATSLDLRSFLARHGDAPLLLVRIPAGDTELELGLTGSAPNAGSGRAPLAKPMPFRTTHHAMPRELPRPGDAGADPRANLAGLLEQNSYFAVALQKREDGDAMFMDRISVGRAHNKDIVLRHASISKFHAWFEVDSSQAVYVSDGGSTNKTQLNGRPLEPRIVTAVEPGDAVKFGTIETVLCLPKGLWACLNPAVSRKPSATILA
jgi:hypothetical protein